MEDYAATIKTLGKFLPTSADYEKVIELWQAKGVIIKEYQYETDSMGKLHIHMYIQVPVSVRMYSKKFRPEGYHIWMEKITNSKGWIKYIRKEQAESKKPAKKLLKVPDEDSKDVFKTVTYKNGTKVTTCKKKDNIAQWKGGPRLRGEGVVSSQDSENQAVVIPLEEMDIVTQQEFLEWRNLEFKKKLFR